jgi:hypothetical protein
MAKDNAFETKANDIQVGEAPNPTLIGLQGPPASCISLNPSYHVPLLQADKIVVKPQPAPPAIPAPKIEEPPPPRINSDLSSVRNVLSVVAPELAILNEIPSDATAKKISERWKTKNLSAPISILLLNEPPEQRALLEQIALALDVVFGPAKIVHAEGIEKEKQWSQFLSVADLKSVIVCDYTLWQLNGLMQFYKEAQGMRTLGTVPLFLLPDLSLYLKDPLLKRSLWKALCQKFS